MRLILQLLFTDVIKIKSFANALDRSEGVKPMQATICSLERPVECTHCNPTRDRLSGKQFMRYGKIVKPWNGKTHVSQVKLRNIHRL